MQRYRARNRSNRALERNADRCENLLSMTSTVNPEAPLALVSGRSASSRYMRTITLIITVIALLDVTARACTVSSKICGTIVVNPTDFVIEVSGPIDPVTVQASDLMVNGIAASTFIITNGNTTITFHFKTSPVVAGNNTMHIPAGAFDCGPPTDFDCTFESFGIHPTPVRQFPTPRPRPTPAPRP